MWDLAEDKHSKALIESFLAAAKPVALVCHAPAALRHVKTATGSPLVSGRNITGFANTEEVVMQLTDVVPFLLEDELRKLGGVYSKGEVMAEHVVVDGLLITGQILSLRLRLQGCCSKSLPEPDASAWMG